MSAPTAESRDLTLTAWAEHLRVNGYSDLTVQHRTRVVRVVATAAGVPACELTHQHVVAYLRAGDYKPRTRENYLTGLRLYSRWAGLGDITADIRRVPVPRGVPKPVSELGLLKILNAADRSTPVFAWIVLGAYIGLRSAESAALKAEDLEENGTGYAMRVVGKGGVERLVPAPPIVLEALGPWILASGGKGRLWPRTTPSRVQCAIRRTAQEAGVPCSSHQLRHRYGTALYRVCHDLLLVQKLMGHSSPLTTAGYALLDLDAGADIVTKLPGAVPSTLARRLQVAR